MHFWPSRYIFFFLRSFNDENKFGALERKSGRGFSFPRRFPNLHENTPPVTEIPTQNHYGFWVIYNTI